MQDLNMEEVQSLFDAVDVDGSGYVDFDEFIEMMRGRLFNDADNAAEVEKDIESCFHLLDRDGTGTICKEEIVNVVCDFCGCLTPEEIDELINWYDVDNDQEINFEEFQEVMFQFSLAELQQKRFIEERIRDMLGLEPDDDGKGGSDPAAKLKRRDEPV